jgi:hypothetical protein
MFRTTITHCHRRKQDCHHSRYYIIIVTKAITTGTAITQLHIIRILATITILITVGNDIGAMNTTVTIILVDITWTVNINP